MKNKLLRFGLLVLALFLFAYYFINNRSQFANLSGLSSLEVFTIFFGQTLVFLSNILLLILFVKIIDKKIAFFDALRVGAYSALINFFGFLQGGIGFRGFYLKKYFSMNLRRYFALTSVQYLAIFGVAGLLIVVGLAVIYNTLGSLFLALAIFSALGALVAFLYVKKVRLVTRIFEQLRNASIAFQTKPILAIFALVLLQLSGSLLAYYTELQAVGADISLSGLFIYTGVSQFSIVVALTPGAIGIREGLLLMVQGQMGISTQDILLASTIDRLVYFAFLAALTPPAISLKRALPSTDKLNT